MHPETLNTSIDGTDLSGLVDSIDEMNLEDNLMEYEAVEDLAPQMIEEIDITELSASDEAAIQIASDTAALRAEVYAAAPTSELAEAAPVNASATKPVKEPKTPKVAGAAKEPKIERDLATLPDAVFALRAGEGVDKAAVLAHRPTQKKVMEKFENLFISLNAGRKPSVYTMACFEALKAAPGSIKMADFVAALEARKYSIGTARSQAGQIANLFTSLGVTSKVAGLYSLNTDSVIADRLTSLMGVAA